MSIDSLSGYLTLDRDDVAMDCCGPVSLCGDWHPCHPLFTLHPSQEVSNNHIEQGMCNVIFLTNILFCGNIMCSVVHLYTANL